MSVRWSTVAYYGRPRRSALLRIKIFRRLYDVASISKFPHARARLPARTRARADSCVIPLTDELLQSRIKTSVNVLGVSMRVIVAARLSRKQASGQQGIGIETQDKRAREWAEREGHDVAEVVADTKSGTVAPWDRRNLRAWVTDPAKLAQYDAVVAYATDRLSRGTQEDFSRIEAWAADTGKALVIVDGPQYPARNDSDYWQWTAQKREARREWEQGRERSMRALGELRDRGKLVGRPPFGYAPDGDKYDKRLVPTETGERYVPQIFERCIAGQSAASIAEWLTAEGVTPRHGGSAWSPKSVAQILRNSVYAGKRRDANGVTVHECASLVDALTFKRAGNALASRPKRGPQIAETALLTGLLSCSDCGGPMYRITTRNGQFYRCSADPKFGAARKSECANMVPLVQTDWLALAALRASELPVTERAFIPGNNHDAEIESVAMELRELPARDLPEDAEDAERARLRAERRRLQELPATPDRWEERETGETYGEMFARLAEDRTELRTAMSGKVTFTIHKRDFPMIGFRSFVHTVAA